MDAKKAQLLDAMKKANKPVRPGELAELVNMDSKEVSKLIGELKKSGDVISPKRCFYAPANQ